MYSFRRCRQQRSSVHFTGSLIYGDFLHLLKLSACHVYLTYPFVLSWSLLEAMSRNFTGRGFGNATCTGGYSNGETGLLVDFFSPAAVTDAVNRLLIDRTLAINLGQKARQLVLERFSLQHACLASLH